jgi:N6-adenosine-specific RNA methylase IME4
MIDLITKKNTGKYSVILADPPWDFRAWSKKGEGRSAVQHYPIMTMEALKALPVGEMVADNAALFLWTTWPTIFRDVPELLEAWGFTYRTNAFIWIKLTKTNGIFTGMGYYTRSNSEPCLLAVRGSMPVAVHNVQQPILSHPGEHSEKPVEVYSRIEQLYPGERYLELFARQKRPGWDTWGNEVVSDIEFPQSHSFSSPLPG